MGDFSSGSVCSMCGRFIDSGVMQKHESDVSMVCFDCAEVYLASHHQDEREEKNSEKRVRRLIRSISAGGR